MKQDREELMREGELQKEFPLDGNENVVTPLPNSLQRMCIRLYHDSIGHPGVVRCTQTLRSKYYWSGCHKQVKEYIQHCRTCHLREITASSGKIPLQRYKLPSAPYERVHWDLHGPFHKTVRGNEYISVSSCALSKHITAVPIERR